MLSPRDALIEEFGLFFERYGLARTFGRVYGLLLLADEPQLSLEEIARALNLSKASASTVTRQLQAMGMIQRAALPGDRRTYYRIAEDAHIRLMELKLQASLVLAALVQKGAHLEGLGPLACRRLKRMARFYDEVTSLIQSFFQTYRDPEEVEGCGSDAQENTKDKTPGRSYGP